MTVKVVKEVSIYGVTYKKGDVINVSDSVYEKNKTRIEKYEPKKSNK